MEEPKLSASPRVQGWKWTGTDFGGDVHWGWAIVLPNPDADPDPDENDNRTMELYVSAPMPDHPDDGPHRTLWTADGWGACESPDEGNPAMGGAVGWIAGPTPESVFAVLDAWILDGDTEFYRRAQMELLTPGPDAD